MSHMWPKADDFFGHYPATDGIMVTDISASGRKWPKKYHTCGRNFKHWSPPLIINHNYFAAGGCLDGHHISQQAVAWMDFPRQFLMSVDP